MKDLRVNSIFMTAKRRNFWVVIAFVLGSDIALHFYSELQKILAVANEPPGWPHSFSWLANAFFVLAYNTFATTVNTVDSPLGIVVLAFLVWGYFATKPARPSKI